MFVFLFCLFVFVYKSLHGMVPCYLEKLKEKYEPKRSLRLADQLALMIPRNKRKSGDQTL